MDSGLRKPPDADLSDSLFTHANVMRNQFFQHLSPAEFLLDHDMNGLDVQQDFVADVSECLPTLKHRDLESLLRFSPLHNTAVTSDERWIAYPAGVQGVAVFPLLLGV